MSGREQKHPVQQAKQRKPMTRTGKIARWPADIRTQLNQRILDGEQGQPLVEWEEQAASGPWPQATAAQKPSN